METKISANTNRKRKTSILCEKSSNVEEKTMSCSNRNYNSQIYVKIEFTIN